MLSKLRPYAKAVVAVAGFLVIAANVIASGGSPLDAVIAVATALGVFGTPNKSA